MNARPPGWRWKTRFLIPLVLCAAHSVTAAASGNPNEKYLFDIEPGDAAYRLNDFSTQSGLQVLYGFESMKHIPITPVHGEMKPFDALDKMIAGTAIRYEFVNRRTVTLTLVPPSVRPSVEAALKNDRGPRKKTDRRAPDTGLDEVTILSDYMPSLSETGSPIVSLNRTEIDAPAFVTVQGAVRTLPQIFGGGPTEDTNEIGFEAQTNTSRGSGVNLRGLGASSTLVLMNGRRLAGTGSQGLFVDVSNLPLAAVERVDILPDSSSTFYGADAVGGVVNFVMREDFDGWQTEAYYGSATKGQLDENYVSQLYGARGEKGRGAIAFDFYSRDNLTAASRPQARSDLTAFGGSNYDIAQSNPGNIVLGPASWAIPRGQDGTSLDASDFQPGTKNLQNKYKGADLLPSQQRWSLFSTGRYQPVESLTLFGDALFSQRDVRGNGGGQFGTFQVTDRNPFYVNPTGVPGPVTVQYNFLDDMGPQLSTGKVRSANASGGLEWHFGSSWSLTASGGYASERLRSVITNQVSNAALATALLDEDPATAFNPFGEGSNTNPATLESLRAHSSLTTDSSLTSGGLLLDGTLKQLPGGDLTLSVGGDVREQSFESRAISTASLAVSDVTSKRRRSIHSAFAELKVPLVGPGNRVRGVESLDLSLAQRYESYSDFGDTLAARLGLSWAPVQGVTLRGTYSESFRPPGLLDLDESTNFYVFLPTRNPQTGGVSNVMLWGGKNRDLREENARSWTAGLELEPARLPGSVLALTFFDTEFVDRLSQPAFAADLLSNPAFSAMVTRDPSADYRANVCSRAPQAASGGNCLTTPIAAIVDFRTRNDAAVKTQGFDLLARYTRDSSLGRLSLGLNGTYLFEFSEARASNLPLQNKVSTPTYPINLRVRTSARWQRGGLDISAYVNYLNSYLDTASLPRRHVDSWTTLDLHATYSLGTPLRSWVGDTTLSLGVDNLLDTEPPFLNNPIGIGYDQENGDLTGRIVSITLRKKW